jgi:hypothetical protein
MLIVEKTDSSISNSFFNQFEKSLNTVYNAVELTPTTSGILSIPTTVYDMGETAPKPKLIRKKVIVYEKVVRHGIKQIKNHKL